MIDTRAHESSAISVISLLARTNRGRNVSTAHHIHHDQKWGSQSQDQFYKTGTFPITYLTNTHVIGTF